jgi:hypothetical protein
MSLPPQWQKWAIPLMQYGVRFSELGHTGGSNGALDQEDGPASERKTAGLFPSPALGERRHRSLARRLVTRYIALEHSTAKDLACDSHCPRRCGALPRAVWPIVWLRQHQRSAKIDLCRNRPCAHVDSARRGSLLSFLPSEKWRSALSANAAVAASRVGS